MQAKPSLLNSIESAYLQFMLLGEINTCCIALSLLLAFIRVFNAFNDSGDFKVMLTTGGGEITPCAKDEFETDNLGFMGVSNRSRVTVGRYTVHTCTPSPPPPTFHLISATGHFIM